MRCTARGFEGIAWWLVTMPSESEHTAVLVVTRPHFLQVSFSEIQSPELAFCNDVPDPVLVAAWTRCVMRHTPVALVRPGLVAAATPCTTPLASLSGGPPHQPRFYQNCTNLGHDGSKEMGATPARRFSS